VPGGSLPGRRRRCARGAGEARLGVALGETAADGHVSLEPVYCRGLCAVAPSAMVDGRVVGRLDAQRLDALLAEVER
jgi:formate dehydrogenase subunit gamma